MEQQRYPVGRFVPDPETTAAKRQGWLDEIRRLPSELRRAARGLTPEQLDTPYRDGGWTLRQVIHHLPDSHLNAYTRFRLALTETEPTIRPYDEAAWAELVDAREADPEISLALLEALHARWVILMESMSPADWARTLVHPERGATLTLDFMLQLYAWHSRHHLAHLTGTRTRMGWAELPATLA